MNFEKIINFFRRPGQAIRKKFAGFRSKKGEKSLGEGKLVTESKKNHKQAKKLSEDRMTFLGMGDVR